MTFQRIARSFVLNVVAASAGLAGTFFITWFYGLAEFAYYTIGFAKLSLILLGTELIPSSFAIFRLQEDEGFSGALPVFYVAFALCAASAAAVLIACGVIHHSSWFMIAFIFTSALQRYFDAQAQASGRVDAFFWIPASSNISRLVLLAALSHLGLSIPNVLWASVAMGSIIGQLIMLSRFPEFLQAGAYRAPLPKLRYLWSIRSSYYGYYLNSLLKRARDTFLPLFSDVVIPSKVEIGRLLVFTRANDAVCGQVRVLEAFMVNRSTRENLRSARYHIFWTVGPGGHLAVASIALALMYRHGISRADVVLAFVAGLFIYPYILELYWRNDALASFAPTRVTLSLLGFLAGLAVPPTIAWAFRVLSIPIFVISYVLAQSLSAAAYLISRRERSNLDLQPPKGRSTDR